LLLETLEDRLLLDGSVWAGYGHDPQHTGISGTAAVSLDAIRWEAPVDQTPPFINGDILAHYGSPVITPAGTVIVPVKTDAAGDFQIEAHQGGDGTRQWVLPSDYLVPQHNWFPSYSPVLTATNRLYYAGAGGTVYYTDNPDATGTPATGHLAFYRIANYHHNLDSLVYIDTPLTADSAGNIYFGFLVTGPNVLNLESGIARIDAQGNGTWIAAHTAAGDDTITKTAMNSAPALSNDGKLLYVAVKRGQSAGGYLLALDSTTLAPVAKVPLRDIKSGKDATVPDDSTASPTVGPDGDVYFGVLENPFPENHDRGWLLHFNSTLSSIKLPGAFGWDDTASIVPRDMVPSYKGNSSYLLMTKYNNYADVGGDGHNKLALLDPTEPEKDPVTGAPVMKEVLTIMGPTPDPNFPDKPGAVREWCINAAAIDPFTKSIMANSEDGSLYRWDLTRNTFTQAIHLAPMTGEAYTPTVIGPNGTVYAINDATLFALQTTATRTTLTTTGGIIPLGQNVTLTAQVAPVIPGTEPAPGQVTFYDGSTQLAVVDLSGGQATFTLTSPTAGNHVFSAVYSGGTLQSSFPLQGSSSNKISAVVRAGDSLFVIGGQPGRVQIRRVRDGALVADFAPYGSAYTGGVSVAVGDVNGDGYQDIVTGATVGNPDVRVYDGRAIANGTFDAGNPNASLLAHWFAYGLNFNVGANVAVGDISGNGFADVVTGATVGNPDVHVYSGKDIAQGNFNPNGGSLLAQWFAYGLQFNIGANVAVGDVNSDGFADVVTGATAGNPDVHVYNGKDIADNAGNSSPAHPGLLAHFFAYGLQFNIGANVAVADVNGDGFGDIITGATAGNPQVRIYDGKAAAGNQANILDQFYAYNLSGNLGVTVAATDFEGNGKADILTGAASGAPHYRVVAATSQGIQPPVVNGLEGIPSDLQGGIAVGA
jgi:hypothetical protein